MDGRVTLAQVAERAGVSVATVSLVLNDRPKSRIGASTREHVRRAARELGYTPNATARALRTGRADTIGFLSDEVTVTRYASAMIRGILDVGEQRERAVLMAESGTHPGALDRALDSMLARPVDALVFGMMRSRAVDLPPVKRGIPRVIANGMSEGFPSVLPDEYRGGYTAARRLIDAGHRRIALIGRSREHLDPAVSVTIPRRLAGVDAAMEEAGLALVAEFPGASWEPELGYRGACAILGGEDPDRRPTAMLAANDRIAFGVYQAAQERGLRIPRDLSVMSFDDEDLAAYLHPPVTTMRLDYRAIGAAAMSLAVDLSTGARTLEEAPAETLVEMPLIERGSVAPPRI